MIVKALRPITKLVTGKGSTGRKRTAKYAVRVKGVTISRHTTKALANAKAKSIRGARVAPIRRTKRR